MAAGFRPTVLILLILSLLPLGTQYSSHTEMAMANAQKTLRRRVSQGQWPRLLMVRAKAEEIAFDQTWRSFLQFGVKKLANDVGEGGDAPKRSMKEWVGFQGAGELEEGGRYVRT